MKYIILLLIFLSLRFSSSAISVDDYNSVIQLIFNTEAVKQQIPTSDTIFIACNNPRMNNYINRLPNFQFVSLDEKSDIKLLRLEQFTFNYIVVDLLINKTNYHIIVQKNSTSNNFEIYTISEFP